MILMPADLAPGDELPALSGPPSVVDHVGTVVDVPPHGDHREVFIVGEDAPRLLPVGGGVYLDRPGVDDPDIPGDA